MWRLADGCVGHDVRTAIPARKVTAIVSAWKSYSNRQRVYGLATTAMHDMSTPPPPMLAASRVGCAVNGQMTKASNN